MLDTSFAVMTASSGTSQNNGILPTCVELDETLEKGTTNMVCIKNQRCKELVAEGVQKIIDNIQEVTPKTIVESIEKELNWGAEKLRDDITCMAININNTELIKKTK